MFEPNFAKLSRQTDFKRDDHCHSPVILSFTFRSNPFYEPKTSSPAQPPAGSPSPDMGSSQKRRAPPPPSITTSPVPNPSTPKPSSGPDGVQSIGPSPVAAVIGRELASSSPKVKKRTDQFDCRKYRLVTTN